MSTTTDTGRVFTGDGQPSAQPLKGSWAEPEPYVASPDLVGAVNVALFLGRPLLLEGEPGSGKTRLAYAVAYEMGYLRGHGEGLKTMSTMFDQMSQARAACKEGEDDGDSK